MSAPRYIASAETRQAEKVLQYLDANLRPLLSGSPAQVYVRARHAQKAPARVKAQLYPGGPSLRVPASTVRLDQSAYAEGRMSEIIQMVVVPMIEAGACPPRIQSWLLENTRGGLARTRQIIERAIMRRRAANHQD